MGRKSFDYVYLMPVIEPYDDVVEHYGVHLKSLNTEKLLFLNINMLSVAEWEKVIRQHLGGVKFEEACALFGGFVLQLNTKNYLFPQCCGTLADIHNWNKVPNLKDDEVVYLSEGHPSAGIKTDNYWAYFDCESDEGEFFPETESNFKVDKAKLISEIERANERLNVHVDRLDKNLAEKFDVKSLRSLFFGKS